MLRSQARAVLSFRLAARAGTAQRTLPVSVFRAVRSAQTLST